MALFFKPHTLNVAAASVADDERNVAKTPTYAAPASVRCHAQETNPETAFQRYGVETKKPVLVFAELADADKFAIGDKVTNISRSGSVWRTGPLYVKAVKRHDEGLPADHVAVVLDEEGK